MAYERSLRLLKPEKALLSYKAMVLIFLWRFVVIGCRVLAFALFTSQCKYWIFVVAACHWLVMICWISTQKMTFCNDEQKNTKCLETLVDMVIAVLYIYCFLNVKEGQTRLRYVIYYTIIYVENLIMTLLLYIFAHTGNSWYFKPALVCIIGGFILGISFHIIYYLKCHPNNYSEYHKSIQLCLKCSEMMNKNRTNHHDRNTGNSDANLLNDKLLPLWLV